MTLAAWISIIASAVASGVVGLGILWIKITVERLNESERARRHSTNNQIQERIAAVELRFEDRVEDVAKDAKQLVASVSQSIETHITIAERSASTQERRLQVVEDAYLKLGQQRAEVDLKIATTMGDLKDYIRDRCPTKEDFDRLRRQVEMLCNQPSPAREDS